MIRWRGITLHHSATADGDTLSWGAIRRKHTDPESMGGNGWDDIGYHFGLEKVQGEYVALVGRPLNETGAHEPKVNRTHIAVCFIGNFDLAPPPAEMLAVARRRIIRPLIELFGIPARVDRDRGIGLHRMYKATACPGRFFTPELVERALLLR